jgi:hypothetical protein
MRAADGESGSRDLAWISATMPQIAQVAIRRERHRRSTPALPQRKLPGWQTEELPRSMVGVHNCENITFMMFVQPRMATIHCAESSRRVANGHSQQHKSIVANGVGLGTRAQRVKYAVGGVLRRRQPGGVSLRSLLAAIPRDPKLRVCGRGRVLRAAGIPAFPAAEDRAGEGAGASDGLVAMSRSFSQIAEAPGLTSQGRRVVKA